MTKKTNAIRFIFILVFLLSACVPKTNDDYKITAKDGQVYYFTGECRASKWGELTVTCYEGSKVVLSIQATSFEILESEN